MSAVSVSESGVRPILAEAVDLARRALAELQPAGVGDHLGVTAEDECAATHRFEATLPGYRGWQWAVVVAAPPEADRATVSESALLPGPDALVAPEFVPWDQRVRPGDLAPGDLLAPRPDDPRLVPGYLATGDPVVDEVAEDIGLGRSQVLSREGREEAAQRWYSEYGPDAEMARAAPSTCGLCGFFIPLAGSLRAAFGVCGNAMGADGHVVHAEYGCGAHSDTNLPTGGGSPIYEAYDDAAVEMIPPEDLRARADEERSADDADASADTDAVVAEENAGAREETGTTAAEPDAATPGSVADASAVAGSSESGPAAEVGGADSNDSVSEPGPAVPEAQADESGGRVAESGAPVREDSVAADTRSAGPSAAHESPVADSGAADPGRPGADAADPTAGGGPAGSVVEADPVRAGGAGPAEQSAEDPNALGGAGTTSGRDDAGAPSAAEGVGAPAVSGVGSAGVAEHAAVGDISSTCPASADAAVTGAREEATTDRAGDSASSASERGDSAAGSVETPGASPGGAGSAAAGEAADRNPVVESGPADAGAGVETAGVPGGVPGSVASDSGTRPDSAVSSGFGSEVGGFRDEPRDEGRKLGDPFTGPPSAGTASEVDQGDADTGEAADPSAAQAGEPSAGDGSTGVTDRAGSEIRTGNAEYDDGWAVSAVRVQHGESGAAGER